MVRWILVRRAWRDRACRAGPPPHRGFVLALVLIALVAGSAIVRASEVANAGLGAAIVLYAAVGLLSASLALVLIARRG